MASAAKVDTELPMKLLVKGGGEGGEEGEREEGVGTGCQGPGTFGELLSPLIARTLRKQQKLQLLPHPPTLPPASFPKATTSPQPASQPGPTHRCALSPTKYSIIARYSRPRPSSGLGGEAAATAAAPPPAPLAPAAPPALLLLLLLLLGKTSALVTRM